MKAKLMILFLFLIGGVNLFSQIKNDSINTVFPGIYVESMPEFRAGGDSNKRLMEFIAKNIQYLETALNDSIEGRVVTQFWIDTSGNTDSHKIIRGLREDLDNEALRVAKLLKFEVPAIQREKPVRIMFTLPFVFDLQKGRKIKEIGYSDREIKAKAKEWIISNSDKEFFDSLYELGIAENNSKKNLSSISCDFYIRTDYDKRFYYRQVIDKKVVTTNDIQIYFDASQNIASYPDINGIYQGYLLYKKTKTLSAEDIKELSDSFSKYKKMNIREVKYIYDLDIKQLYLEVIREKKFGTGITERQQLDIQNKLLIKKEGPSFLRRMLNVLQEIFY